MTGGEVMSTYVIPAGCMLCARQAGPKITLRFPREQHYNKPEQHVRATENNTTANQSNM